MVFAPQRDEADASAALVLLQDELRRLRLEAGQPSLRAIAKDVGWSHATIARAFTGANAPKWDLVEALAAHLDGNPDHIRTLWIASMGAKPRPEPAPHSSSPARAPFPVIGAIAAICALLIVIVLRDLAPEAVLRNERITGVAQLLFVATAALLWWRVALRQRRRENLAVALCLSGWLVAAAWQVIAAAPWKLPPTLPPVIDIVVTFLPSTCFVVLTTASLPRRQRKATLLVLAVTAPICFALFLLSLRHAELSAGVTFGYAALSTLYAASFLLSVRIALLKKNWTWTLLLAGVIVVVVTDLMMVYFVATRPNQTIPIGAVIGLLVCPLVMSVAARCAALEATTEADTPAAAAGPGQSR
ncbi:helix-turn-helix domain-containing protein [Segniliparus rugosus]|uniref:HTH cro/C1-type domain-containing protein n=1 Tax=Segniliparus rugosus (strain ATCC BAA-974 / DSM 45345 / CCUG 50838 / CIP 108380 / JCM 13579 / CDC 945) TaxID=679197 RepID=E5XRQ3_SEGRC|nr:helix-turn-helix transcriptional regulator [Segniliparus rugosus]EFV12918.1 hypothetical protein HMPREF9336_02175 [Segniliparus rugosus ATCC BAA-974]